MAGGEYRLAMMVQEDLLAREEKDKLSVRYGIVADSVGERASASYEIPPDKRTVRIRTHSHLRGLQETFYFLCRDCPSWSWQQGFHGVCQLSSSWFVARRLLSRLFVVLLQSQMVQSRPHRH